MIETFEHPSDIGVRGIGKNLQEAFAETARCVFSIIADPREFKNNMKVTVECSASTREELLLDLINRLLAESAIRRCVFTEFKVHDLKESVEGWSLKAEARGGKMNKNNLKGMRLEVKAATYFQLKVLKKGGKTVAQCVVDV